MQEVLVKTHLIVTEVHDEYEMDWCGKLADTNPLFVDDKPVFVIIGSKSRMELNTIDMRVLEDNAKRMTYPKGRQAVTKDVARIYIKEVNGHEHLIGRLTHRHIKCFAPMFDKVGYK